MKGIWAVPVIDCQKIFIVLLTLLVAAITFSVIFTMSSIYSQSLDPDTSMETLSDLKMFSSQVPFIENQGQLNPDVFYYAKTFAGTVFVSNDGLTYAFKGSSEEDTLIQGVVVKENFLPWQTLQPNGLDKSETIVSYFVGDKENWQSSIPAYNVVSLGEVWPSIDVELRAYGNTVEKIFKVSPGGSVSDIWISFDGIEYLKTNEEGKLLLNTELGVIEMTKPIAYQFTDEGIKTTVDASYKIITDN